MNWPQDWERSVFIPIPRKGNTKECSNYRTIALMSHAGKVMLKILQARLQQYVSRELPDVQDGFRKGRGIRDQIGNIRWIIEKAREFQKNIYFCFIDYAKAFDCVDHNKLSLEKLLCRSGSNMTWSKTGHGAKLDMEQQTDSKYSTSRLGEISITSDMWMTPPLWQKAKRN